MLTSMTKSHRQNQVLLQRINNSKGDSPIEFLDRENELLRLEVEYLKKLRAFQMDPEGYLEKHKQRYHSNSKKPSN